MARTRAAWVRACATASVVLVASGQAMGQTWTHSFIGDAERKRVYDKPAMKALGAAINGKFKNLVGLVSACHCGGFYYEGATFLEGKMAVAVTRSQDNVFLYATDTCEKDKHHGERGYKTGKGNWWTWGWEAQWAKELNATPNATAQDLLTAATNREFDSAHHGGQFPRLLKMNNGENETVKVDAGKGEAIYWQNLDSNYYYNTYLTVQRRGYWGTDKKNSRIDSAYQNSDDSNFGGDNVDLNGNDPPCYVDRKATGANLKTMMTGLGTRLNADAGNLTALVLIVGHGNIEKVKADKFPDAAEGLAAQGKKITDGQGTLLDLDAPFIANFFEGTTVFTPGAQRFINASVTIRTFEEDFAGEVDVSVDGVAVGSFNLTDSPTGGDYAIEIPDGVMVAISNQGLLNDLQANITFDFPPGTPSLDGFRIATEWDMDLDLTEFYGIGLAAPSIAIRSALCEADLNDDQRTNVSDFAILASHYGTVGSATWEVGDLNGDGNVNVFDFAILAVDFGCDVH